jgi:LemA protein
VDIHGEPDYVGRARYEDGKWILTGANTSGRGGYHNVTVLKPVTTGVELTAKIQTSDLSDPRSGGGLLLSAHGLDVGIMAFPAQGTLVFFSRSAVDGRTLRSQNVPLPSAMLGQAGAFLKLALADGKVTAFYGTDTNNWTQVGETPPLNQMAADATGGMELFSMSGSHFASTVALADFQTSPFVAPPVEQRAVAQKSNPPTPSRSTEAPQVKPRAGHFLAALVIWGIIIIVVGAIFCIIKPFNRLVYLRNRTRKGWAQIDVQLKRRHDLIDKCVELVKGYAKHESTTLENVTSARAAAMNAVSIQERARAESALNVKMKSLYAVAEAYPDLKANQNFLSLQHSLTTTEDMLAAARSAYNEEVLTYNTEVQSFPTNLVALAFRFKERAFFEMDEAEEREAPNGGGRNS